MFAEHSCERHSIGRLQRNLGNFATTRPVADFVIHQNQIGGLQHIFVRIVRVCRLYDDAFCEIKRTTLIIRPIVY
jgi:hypothetical protein